MTRILDASAIDEHYDLLIDAVFGFSFKGESGIRSPFDDILTRIGNASCPIVSIDVPSGWTVDSEEQERPAFIPEMVISLTAPKLCMSRPGAVKKHYLAGRFIPPEVVEQFGLGSLLQQYQGANEFVKMSSRDQPIDSIRIH